MLLMRQLLVALILFWYCPKYEGSYGDYEPNYQHCFQYCLYQCDGNRHHLEDLRYPPFNVSSIISWDCWDRCHYSCMNEITIQRRKQGKEVYKYYGHWPFLRWFGMEEPASAIFSLLNAFPHLHWLVSSRFISPLEQHSNRKMIKEWYMFHWLQGYAIIAINAWIASTLFHIQKKDGSIWYDYTSALLLLCAGFWLILRRVGGKDLSVMWQWLGAGGLSSYAGYRIYLMYYHPRRISFQQHLHFCIGLGVITTLVWFGWIGYEYIVVSKYQLTRSKQYAIIIQIWFIVASMFEIFDFAPFFQTFDAHSCWHGLTIPLGFIFYKFWQLDYQEQFPVTR